MTPEKNNPSLSAIILADEISHHFLDFNLSPICLLKFHNQTLLERYIISLNLCGVENSLVVAGYMKEEISYVKEARKLKFKMIENESYSLNGDAYSLYLGLKDVHQDVIIMNSDILLDHHILENFIFYGPMNSILCGSANIEDLKVTKIFTDKNFKIRSIASKRHPNITETTKHIFQGESIGIIKLSNDYRIKLVEFMDQLFCEEYNKSIKLDKLLMEFIKKHHFFAFKTKSDKWIEIDTNEDYKKAIAFSQKIPPVG